MEHTLAATNKMHYFAYGSNMLTVRLRERVASAKPVGRASLRCHLLHFNKKGIDGSGKCDAFATGQERDIIWGVLFDISTEEKHQLDEIEGLGSGYEIKRVNVELGSGNIQSAFTYYATATNSNLLPFEWYKAFVIAGAIEHRLPREYVNRLKRIRTQPDPQTDRQAANTRILGLQS